MAFASLQAAQLLPPPDAAVAWGWRPKATPRRFVLGASGRGRDPAPPTFERLREQLLQLHAEADLTQSKANSARVRLMRLTEAAENLKKRATASVRMGKENEAVELLMQKKKLTKALESIKERIDVLDKLSAKISEAISVKQDMLIEHALHPGMASSEYSNDKTRVFSSKVDDGACETDGYHAVEKGSMKAKHGVNLNMASHCEKTELQMSDRSTFSKGGDTTNNIKNCSPYADFLQHIDSQLNSLEYEFAQFISSQLAEEGGVEKPINGKRQEISDLLRHVTETREKIAKILNNTLSEAGSEDLRGQQTTGQ